MSKFEPNKRHLRELLIYFFNLKKSAAEAHRLLVEAYNEAALSERTCREWFQKFKKGDFDVKDKDRSGRPKIYEDAELEELLEEDSSQTQKKLALTLEVTQQAVSHRLKSLGMIHKQAKEKPNTRSKRIEALKEANSIPADTKEKKKNTSEKLPKSPKVPRKETKTNVKPVKKVVEKNEAIVEEKKKATKAKTTKSNTKVMNDDKKAKARTTKKMQEQADVSDEAENNVEETNIPKPVKGRSKRTNKDNAKDHSKKVNNKEVAAINEEENKLQDDQLIMEKVEEEEEDDEKMEVEPNEISKNNNLQKKVTNNSNISLNLEDSDSTPDEKEVSMFTCGKEEEED
ncbi:PREDICTED: flap endonuclease 1-like isoform X2 [Polistes dominula]|uniref:Flap endonuclease 1-like isoform X2 n=1 Tax=Polistes dominula TaxID=743375 RepID=A0ABM1IF86_POLDO|nr:PREDICTED: flap endonuclease 1-like isoform X2 [Polistes dominula]